MKILTLKSGNLELIRFRLYENEAPETCKAFLKILPFQARGVQARFAGEEIWIKKGPRLKVSQENASVNLKSGELGYAAPFARSSVSRSIAIVYGQAHLADAVNVFARVMDQDFRKLQKLGEAIWLRGAKDLKFEIK